MWSRNWSSRFCKMFNMGRSRDSGCVRASSLSAGSDGLYGNSPDKVWRITPTLPTPD